MIPKRLTRVGETIREELSAMLLRDPEGTPASAS
jgi:hypothetical protein